MAKKKSSAPKHDLQMRMKNTTMEIDEVGANGIEFESHNKGRVTGRLYSGVQYDTVKGRISPDGASEFSVKFIQMTSKGEMVVGTGSGNQDLPDKRGKAAFRGQVTTWTGSARLVRLNGAKWNFEGIRNLATDTADIRATITEEGGSQMQLQSHDHDHNHDHG